GPVERVSSQLAGDTPSADRFGYAHVVHADDFANLFKRKLEDAALALDDGFELSGWLIELDVEIAHGVSLELSVKEARAYRGRNGFQSLDDTSCIASLGVHHDIAQIRHGAQVLRREVDVSFGEYRVDRLQYAG